MTINKELIYFPSWTAGRKGYADRINQIFEEYHRSKGLRLTDQRLAILNYLLHADRHLSEQDIYGALKSHGVGKVTVFRTLKVLEECHLVEPVTDSKGHVRYEVNLERPHHDHLICTVCNRIIEIQWPTVEKTQEKMCRAIGFEISHHRHEIYGRCKDCQT
jgi:Fur family transcriptional regulator, ferric uptake regulator